MRAVDPNVLVRLMTRDDAKQVAVAEAFVATGAWVPHLAIAETTWVLARIEEYTAGGRESCVASHLIQDGVIRNLQTLAGSSETASSDDTLGGNESAVHA